MVELTVCGKLVVRVCVELTHVAMCSHDYQVGITDNDDWLQNFVTAQWETGVGITIEVRGYTRAGVNDVM